MAPRQFELYSHAGSGKHWQGRHPLLQRHPILVSLCLISGAVLLVMASYFADTLFPILAFIGASPALPCLSLAWMSGTCGILISIINIIEHVEQRRAYAVVSPALKEQRYDRN
ncbi:hypothetical protein [Dictyobacter aurantiacus]|uniref:Uncharacterized protein n=1 Tax=Dictyobacter aurantiacus TaxID=1936993 RepID=A0A401ZHE8_9CHLR|nr:hypothetical protein [Dictyobacter aurantiacus]GCE06266.1 hypothetical protein KDAU_35950 [Dictyobacter aurantiacus]